MSDELLTHHQRKRPCRPLTPCSGDRTDLKPYLDSRFNSLKVRRDILGIGFKLFSRFPRQGPSLQTILLRKSAEMALTAIPGTLDPSQDLVPARTLLGLQSPRPCLTTGLRSTPIIGAYPRWLDGHLRDRQTSITTGSGDQLLDHLDRDTSREGIIPKP
jgi:hypothetical protein